MTSVKGFEISCRFSAYCGHIKKEKKVLILVVTERQEQADIRVICQDED